MIYTSTFTLTLLVVLTGQSKNVDFWLPFPFFFFGISIRENNLQCDMLCNEDMLANLCYQFSAKIGRISQVELV